MHRGLPCTTKYLILYATTWLRMECKTCNPLASFSTHRPWACLSTQNTWWSNQGGVGWGKGIPPRASLLVHQCPSHLLWQHIHWKDYSDQLRRLLGWSDSAHCKLNAALGARKPSKLVARDNLGTRRSQSKFREMQLAQEIGKGRDYMRKDW